jgi:hypothetical protein
MKILHIVLLAIWILLVIPSLLWWSNSVTWVIFMSIYAIIAMHALALQQMISARKQKALTIEHGSSDQTS